MAEKLNQRTGIPSEIEPTAEVNASSDFTNGVHLNETQEAKDLNEYFDDKLHLDRLGNIADEHANWVYFGVGGPA
mgnify:FL=1